VEHSPVVFIKQDAISTGWPGMEMERFWEDAGGLEQERIEVDLMNEFLKRDTTNISTG